MADFLPVFVLLFLSTGLALLVILISVLFGPRKRAQNPMKVQPYESGMRAIGPAQRRLPVRFYLIAVLFILFDIEVVFFYPWAAAFRQLGWYGFVTMFVFATLLLVGYIWLWKKGALEWESLDKRTDS